MTIDVNGERTTFKGSVADLVEAQFGSHTCRGIAVAVNDEVVARSRWAQWTLVSGDQVEIVTAVQGG